MPKVIAQTPIKYDGKRHAPGGTLEMSAKAIAALPPGSVVVASEPEPQDKGKSKEKAK